MIKSEQPPVKVDAGDENGQGGWLSSFLTKKNGYPENGGESGTQNFGVMGIPEYGWSMKCLAVDSAERKLPLF